MSRLGYGDTSPTRSATADTLTMLSVRGRRAPTVGVLELDVSRQQPRLAPMTNDQDRQRNERQRRLMRRSR